MERNNHKAKIITRKKGVVKSNRMNGTVIIEVVDFKAHSKYKKKYRSSKRYKVHSGEKEFNIGEVVHIKSMKPKSKNKHYEIA